MTGIDTNAPLQTTSVIYQAPLLSICIPTYSRVSMLDTCLASLLPQTQQYAGRIECIVSDNASIDRTSELLRQYQQEFTFEVSRNDHNIGILGNITKVAGQLAKGDYVWVIGDDDVVTAGAVQRILNFIERNRTVDLVALNVGYRPGDSRPAALDVRGGITDRPNYTLRQSDKTSIVPAEELFAGPTVDLTASYSTVMRRRWWVESYPEPYVGEPFTDVRSMYPSAYTIAEHLAGARCGLVGEPSIMIHEMPSSDFSWAKYRGMALLHVTSLFEMYEHAGIPHEVLRPYYRYQLTDRGDALGDLLWNRDCAGGWREAGKFAIRMGRYPWLLFKAFCIAMLHPHAPRLLSTPFHLMMSIKRMLSRALAQPSISDD
ncbi:glycosyltransferase family 2 protein [Roseiconus nitratireducens]|uniref:Glycosyltransferase family 2 protein n=1 Tax=Roseiconus nitratireducens TaxID=2605748 RepID=A0A5M6D3U1_9BACT|nr:glycosyltransferase family 2 protein [Roseiconus nitratireducens]KAA5542161.1 glycosyltransferase family 2 protein [Roseiconus nitratireducens]